MNYSWQRQLIIETIQKTREHMTAAQIADIIGEAAARGPAA